MSDRYQIISLVGTSSAGTIHRGWDKHQNRDVSIQKVKGQGDSAQEALREARALYGLRHPNVVSVFEYGSDEEGVYVVREMIKGKPLESIVAQRPLSEKEFTTLVQQTLSALAAAHTSGLIHRNLQPGTIMVPWNAQNNFSIKIADFSLGPPSPEVAAQRSLESEHFMAPEQFGNAPVTLHTDLYSLGAILYYCLTQKHAFQGTHSADIVIAHLYHRFVPLADLRPDLSRTLCVWVERLMKQHPVERPATAEEALQMFKMIPDEEIMVAAPIVEKVMVPIFEEEEPPVAAAMVEEAEEEEVAMAASAADEEDQEEPLAATESEAPAFEAEEETSFAPELEPDPEPEPEEMAPLATAAPVSARMHVASSVRPAEVDDEVATARSNRPPTKAPRRGGMPAMTFILMAFGAILVGMLGLVSYLKYSSKGDREQRVQELSESEHPQGSDLDVRLLLDSLEEPDHLDAAANALGKLEGGEYIDTMILEHFGKTRAYAAGVKLVEISGQRRIPGAFDKVLPLTNNQAEDMRKAAWTTLAKITDHGELPRLIASLGKSNPKDAELIEATLVDVVEGASDKALANKAAIAGYHAAEKDAASRAILLNVLTRTGGGPETLEVITSAISDPSEDVRRAAIILLAEYPTHDPLAAITARFPEETDAACRIYLLLAAKELVSKPGSSSQDTLARHVQSLYANAKVDDEKEHALAAIGSVIAPSTANFYESYASQGNPSLQEEALALSKAYQKRAADIISVSPDKTSTVIPAEHADFTLGGSISFKNDILTNWTRESDSASWLIQFPANGEYEVVIYQAHDGKANGTYEVLLAGQTKLTAAVKTGGKEDFKGFVVGQFTISEPGIYKLLVRPKKIPTGGELFRVQKLAIKLL